MLDQSFSPNNFYDILLSENRKGRNLEKDFFKTEIYDIYTMRLKEINQKLRLSIQKFKLLDKKHRNPSKEVFKRYKRFLLYLKRKTKREKREKLLKLLEVISNNIQKDSFTFNMTTNIVKNKTVYKINNNREEFFAIKQLQRNFNKLYKIKQANRFEIVNQLKNIFEDKFPKVIIKTDLKDFYENLPSRKILNQLNKDNLLSPKSKKLLKEIIKKYKDLSGTGDKGIPRGIGISPYLAEYYMRKFDEEIKLIDNLLYYARYVDDIIIIFVPNLKNNIKEFCERFNDIVEKFGVLLNYDKTQIIEYINKKFNIYDFKDCKKIDTRNNYKLDYLGYSFLLNEDDLKITITQKKLKKYKKKIYLAFKEYIKYKNDRKGFQHLRDRIKYLSSNYRLYNNKSHILSGIYFSNMLCSDLAFLDEIDNFYKWLINRYIKKEGHKQKLKNFSFRDGFEKKEFSQFTLHQIKKIIRIWKDV